MKTRLSKYLSDAGVASRRACEKLVFEKRVSVNGTIVSIPQYMINESDKILLDNKPLPKKETQYYLMLNKPRGYVCSHARRNKEKLVYDLTSNIPARLFTLGRLDKDTNGLIILTNDGSFSNKVIHPSQNIAKEYLVRTSYEITASHLKDISNGCKIQGKWITPKSVKKVRRGTLKIVVKEGLKHEVRKLVASAGLDLLELKRIRIGGLRLGTLPEGHFEFLEEKHLNQIFN